MFQEPEAAGRVIEAKVATVADNPGADPNMTRRAGK